MKRERGRDAAAVLSGSTTRRMTPGAGSSRGRGPPRAAPARRSASTRRSGSTPSGTRKLTIATIDGELAVEEEPERLVDDSQPERLSLITPSAAEDRAPCVDAHQVAAEQADQHQEVEAPAPVREDEGDDVGERVGQDEDDRRDDRREHDRAEEQRPEDLAGEHLEVVLEREVRDELEVLEGVEAVDAGWRWAPGRTPGTTPRQVRPGASSPARADGPAAARAAAGRRTRRAVRARRRAPSSAQALISCHLACQSS